MTIPLRLEVDLPDLLVGLVVARGVTPMAASPELLAEIEALVATRAGTDFPPPEIRAPIRDLLRSGGFKPTGRNKPASEYLARAADRDAFPHITNIVDVLNLHSLETGIPISLLDLDRALEGTDELVLRAGRADEEFVFNQAGQVIDVAGLLLVARTGGEPLANPVKDSMTSKTTEATRNVLAVLYASRRMIERSALVDSAAHLAERYGRHCGAESVESAVLP